MTKAPENEMENSAVRGVKGNTAAGAKTGAAVAGSKTGALATGAKTGAAVVKDGTGTKEQTISTVVNISPERRYSEKAILFEELHALLEDRQKVLEECMQSVDETESSRTHIRVSKSKKEVCYYLVNETTNKNGKYISKVKNQGTIAAIFQKSYSKKLLSFVRKEITLLENFLNAYPQKTINDIYESLSSERKEHVTPLSITDASFIGKWLSQPCPAPFFTEDDALHYTKHGTRVRSKSEVIIGTCLEDQGIPYLYEFPIKVNASRTVRPDFKVLNSRTRKEYYWEHFGLIEEPLYFDNMVKKLKAYASINIFPGDNLIMTFETKNQVLNTKYVEAQIEHYLL